uniref:Peptidase_M13_N domain-containing protein n=1 Tax=Heligmosomoides polygyrus TaxID=6339 RepID=A0A8L8KAX5_HELPZ
LNLFARDFYVLAENEERLAYLQLIRDVLVLLHAPVESATHDAKEIIEFETALANVSEVKVLENVVAFSKRALEELSSEITMADEQRHDIAEMYTKMTLGQMKEQLPNFDWQLFFNQVFRHITDENGTQVSFDEKAEVVVYGIEFLTRLDKLLPQFEKKRVVNYLEWCWFFKTMLRDLPDPFALTIFKFYKTLNLMNVQKVRWHGCVTRINSLMPMATSSIYVKHHFDHEAKKQVSSGNLNDFIRSSRQKIQRATSPAPVALDLAGQGRGGEQVGQTAHDAELLPDCPASPAFWFGGPVESQAAS